jgi:hypothetical protein
MQGNSGLTVRKQEEYDENSIIRSCQSASNYEMKKIGNKVLADIPQAGVK